MSDEEHQFESKADAGASKTFPQQAGTIRKNGYIVIKGRACKVVEVSTSKTGKHGHAKCHFVAIDIFNGKKLEDIVPSSHNCDVPHVNRTDYQLIDILEDGFASNCNQYEVLRASAQLNDVAIEKSMNSIPVPETKSEELTKKSASQNTISDVSSISAFMNQVADLVELVDSRDIMELQLKQENCEVLIRKKEALM